MPRPFFIVGSGRCGATWLYEILRHHERIALTNEARVLDFLYFCNELVNLPSSRLGACVPCESITMRGLVRDAYLPTLSKVFLRHCKDICEAFYREHFADRDYLWWGDKLPDPRVALGAQRLWPDARYLLLVRDPRDVLCSWRAFAKRREVHEQHPELLDYPASILAASWQAIYSGLPQELDDVMILRYEDLCAQPRQHIEAFLGYLDLAWSDSVAQALRANRSFEIHGTSASLEASLGRWRSELSAADVEIIEGVCSDVMQTFGYEVAGQLPREPVHGQLDGDGIDSRP